jgi:hypothetical protein
MRRFLLPLVLTSFASLLPVSAGEYEEADRLRMSDDAEQAFGDFEEELLAAKIAYDLAVQEAKTKFEKALQREMHVSLNEGKLEAAQKINALQAKLQDKSWPQDVDVRGSPITKEVEVDTTPSFVGITWHISHEGWDGIFMQFTADGKCKGAKWSNWKYDTKTGKVSWKNISGKTEYLIWQPVTGTFIDGRNEKGKKFIAVQAGS